MLIAIKYKIQKGIINIVKKYFSKQGARRVRKLANHKARKSALESDYEREMNKENRGHSSMSRQYVLSDQIQTESDLIEHYQSKRDNSRRNFSLLLAKARGYDFACDSHILFNARKIGKNADKLTKTNIYEQYDDSYSLMKRSMISYWTSLSSSLQNKKMSAQDYNEIYTTCRRIGSLFTVLGDLNDTNQKIE